MLTLQALNPDAQLNTFLIYSNIFFVNGADTTVLLRIFDSRKNIRYIPDAGATFSIDLQNSDGTTLAKVPTNPFADDRSIISFNITAAESANLISQNIVLSIDEGGSSSLAVLRNGLSKVDLSGSC